MLVAGTAPSRNANVTPPRWSSANSARLVAVSSAGAPASAGPGAGVSLVFGVGAAGGITFTALRVVACARLPAHAASGPDWARIGTGTASVLSLDAWTPTDTS